MSDNHDKSFYVLGMSPGNSYFKDDEVKYLLRTIVEKHGRVAILIADVPAISTYIAFGYKENRARRDKAIPQGNALKNRVKRAMSQLGYDETQVKIIDWAEEVEENADYQKEYKKIKDLYDNNQEFQQKADQTTRSVLEGSRRKIDDIENATKTAVHYLLSEFAFLEFAPKFLGSEKVIYVYHKNWPVYEDYIAGKFDGKQKEYLDFWLLENPWETYNPLWGLEDDTESNDEYENTLERVKKTKVLRVAFSNYPPALMYDRDYDNFSGIFYEILVEIARENGWQIKWTEETGYGVIIDGLNSNRFDVFGSPVWPIPQRKKGATLSESLYKSPVFPWIRESDSYDDLNDQSLRVVVKENDISHAIAETDYPNARMVYVPQLSETSELLEFVAEDKADFTFVEPYLAEYFNSKTTNKIKKGSEESVRVYENTFMFKAEDASLKSVFDKKITDMKEKGSLERLVDKYASKDMFFWA